MNIFLDTEFTGLHKNTTLISLGLVSECGKAFYAEFTDYDKSQVDDWLQDNVLGNLVHPLISNPHGKDISDIQDCIVEENTPNYMYCYGIHSVIKFYLSEWLSQFDSVRIISDVPCYDWVLFCDIFGNAFDIPQNVNYIVLDLATMFFMKGIDVNIDRQEFSGLKNTQHHALDDAKVIKACYDKLMRL